MNVADIKYKDAIALYASTNLTISEISNRCGVSRGGFARFIQRAHRDLMLKRHGVEGNPESRMRHNHGQRRETREKYRDAIQACDNIGHIHLNISQIARKFGVNPAGLANQLRAHYPEILKRREVQRDKLGIADNYKHGMSHTSKSNYSGAVALLSSSDITIEEAADKEGVSFSGLRQHLQFYHKNLLKNRELRRQEGADVPKIGRISGNGQQRIADDAVKDKYAEAVNLYSTTSLNVKEIADRTGVTVSGLRNHLRKWHRNLMFERRGSVMPSGASDRESFDGTKRYDKAVKEKYGEAIEYIRMEKNGIASVAKRFGFNPDIFRAYVREHAKDLYDEMGMIIGNDGKRTLKRSHDKYAAAVELYSASNDSLKSIAERLGLTYKSLSSYMRRNHAGLMESRKRKV